MKINKIFLMLCFLSIFLTGCFDKVELEERALVLAIGIDKYTKEKDTNIEKTGEEKRFIVSMALPDVTEEEKGKEDNKNENKEDSEEQSPINKNVKTAEGSSISSTLNLIDTYTSKNLYYGHTKVVVLGIDILKDEKLLKETIDALERNNEISRKIIVLGTDEKAEDILKTIPKDEKMLGIYINDFYKSNKNTSFTYRVDLEDVVKAILSTGDVAIPSIKIEDNDIKLEGLIALKNSKYAGYLDDATTKGILWLIDKRSLSKISVPFEDGYVSTSIFKKNVDKNFHEENNKIIANFNVNIEGNISEYFIGENILIDTNKYKKIEEKTSNYVKKEILSAIKNIKKLNVDIINLKELIIKNNYDLYVKYNLENKNIYNVVDFNINCNVKIKGSGSVK